MSSPRDRTLWVSTAGAGTAYGVLKSVRERWGDGVRIVAADVSPAHLCVSTALADEYVQLPAVSDPHFVDALLAGLARSGAGVYLPILDAEVVLAAELAADGRLPPGATALAPEREVARICADKPELFAWLRARGLPAAPASPETPRGPEVAVDAFRSRDGRFFRAVCRERMEAGPGAWAARIYMDDELGVLARTVADQLPLPRTFCLEATRATDGAGWRIVDVVAGPGAGTRMTAAVGIDFACAALAEAWGEDPTSFLLPLAGERWVARAYTEHVLK